MQFDRELDARLSGIASQLPSQTAMSAARRALTGDLKPVRTLPANRVLVATALGAFLAAAILFTIPVKFTGFHRLSVVQLLVLYPVVVVSAWLMARCLVEQMIPGARRTLPPVATLVVCTLVMAALMPLLFPDFNTTHFEQGVKCLRLGLICAVPSGFMFWLLLRRGFVVNAPVAGTTAGALAGLVGVGVLCLHCPVLIAPHIVVWHLGVVVISALSGAGIAMLLRPR